jgi:hypothetical protein
MTQRTPRAPIALLAFLALALGAGATWWILDATGRDRALERFASELAPSATAEPGGTAPEELAAPRRELAELPNVPTRIYERVRLEILVQAPPGRELAAPVEVTVEPAFDDGGAIAARLRRTAAPRREPPVGAVAGFDDLLPASYRVIATAPGLDAVLTIVELDPRSEVQRISLALAPLGSLSGNVHSGEDPRLVVAFAPVALQRVELDLTGERPRRETQSDASGRYRFEDLPPGSYDLSVGPLGRALRTPLRVEIANEPARMDLGGLPAVGEVALQLFDEIGTPLGGVVVDLVPPSPEALGGNRGLTDEQGSLRLGGLPAGEYLIHAQREGYHPLQSRLELSELHVPLVQPLVLRAF